MPNIYYIEDNREHFESVKRMLESHNYAVLPKPEKWAEEMTYFIQFLHSQTSPDTKSTLIEMFTEYKIELLLIDVGLGVDALGNGEDIYKNLIQKSPSLKLIPAIYLTMVGRGSVSLSTKTRHVTKVFGKANQIDINAIETELVRKIRELLKLPNEMNFLDRVIKSI